MKKLLAVGILAGIPIGFSVPLYIEGGLGALLLFWGLLAGAVVVGLAVVWALVELEAI